MILSLIFIAYLVGVYLSWCFAAEPSVAYDILWPLRMTRNLWEAAKDICS